MDTFKIAMALHKIAMSVDDETLGKIQSYLNTIEKEVVEETRKGVWKEEEFNGLLKCSECGMDAPVATVGGQWASKFCPSCGAEMEYHCHKIEKETEGYQHKVSDYSEEVKTNENIDS